MKFEETAALPREWESGKEPQDIEGGGAGAPAGSADSASEAALGALLESASAGADADDDPERRVARLGVQLARLDALNVAGMLAAATEGGGAGAELARRLDDGLGAAAALTARLRRCEALARGAPDAVHARSGAARADANARALLRELADVFSWLDAPPLRDLDALPETPLGTAEGRARALAACAALRAALRAEPGVPAHVRRLAAVRERLRRLARARDALAAAVARHVNNLLIHLGNEAAAGAADSRPHADLLPLAPFMRCLKDMDEKAFDGLAKVYTAMRARALERETRGACDAARAALAPPASSEKADELLDGVLNLVEALCNAEQDFCAQFFFLDVDVKSDGSDGERSEKSDGGRGGARGGAESRRFMAALFPALEPALLALTQHLEKHDRHGAFVALACVGRRVVGAGAAGAAGAAGEAGEARWARAALAGAAVAAKRQADRAVAARAAALGEAVRAAARRPKCGVLPFVAEFEEFSAACERIFAGGRRADLERWMSQTRDTRRRAARASARDWLVNYKVLLAGRRHGGGGAARGAPAHAARRGAHGELPRAARRAQRAARAGAGAHAPRVPRALRRGAARVRHAVLRPPARAPHGLLRGRGRGRGGRRARGRGVLPRRLLQARAAPRAGALPRRRGAPRAAPPLPHRRETPLRAGRPLAGRVARHAGGVLAAARGATGAHRGVLPGGGADAAADHAAHPRRLLGHRARTLTVLEHRLRRRRRRVL